MHYKGVLVALALILLSLLPATVVSSYAQPGDGVYSVKYIVVKVSQVPALIGCRQDSLRAVTYLPGGGIVHGRLFIAPREFVASNSTLKGLIEIPVLGNGLVDADTVLMVQLLVPQAGKDQHAAYQPGVGETFPWPVEYAKDRVRSRAIVQVEPGSLVIDPARGLEYAQAPMTLGLYCDRDPRGSNAVFDKDVLQILKYAVEKGVFSAVRIVREEHFKGFVVDLKRNSISAVLSDNQYSTESVSSQGLIVIEGGGGPSQLYQFVYPLVPPEFAKYLAGGISYNSIYLGPYVYNVKLNIKFSAVSPGSVLEVKYVLKNIDPTTGRVLSILESKDLFFEAPTTPTLITLYPSNVDYYGNLSMDISLNTWVKSSGTLQSGGNISLRTLSVYVEKLYPEMPIPQTRRAVQVLSTGVQSSILPSNTSSYFRDAGAYFYVPYTISLSATLINGQYLNYITGNGSIKVRVVIDNVSPFGTSTPFSGWVAIYVNNWLYTNKTVSSRLVGSVYMADTYTEVPIELALAYFEMAAGPLLTITVNATDIYGSRSYIRAYVDAWVEEWYAPEVWNPYNPCPWIIYQPSSIQVFAQAIESDLRVVDHPTTILGVSLAGVNLGVVTRASTWLAFEIKASGVRTSNLVTGVHSINLRIRMPLEMARYVGPSAIFKSGASIGGEETVVQLAGITHSLISFIFNVLEYAGKISSDVALVIDTVFTILGILLDVRSGGVSGENLRTWSDGQFYYVLYEWSPAFQTVEWASARIYLNSGGVAIPSNRSYVIYVSGSVNGKELGEFPVSVYLLPPPIPEYDEPSGVYGVFNAWW
ncbi:hypothetical protein TCELL_0132 [Thermogladius calderae 1633]|uniref:Uncharacterized protein n=1 Tax=Thermogladius calderae (strain DSM 22663 / VKM B-2946 / 1633) TaxID=1184251 RepID=I3TCR9_THEC1|nr:hypothetical protein [Thermogladius calderae]AFK50557.1 hypothetical protein TCELL_0132 [Thermogladius calderae 1633]